MTSVDRVLAKAIMDLMISIDLTDDDEIDPDVATKITEPVCYDLINVTDEVRQELIRLFREAAEEEDEPVRRAMAMSFPEDIGLLEEE